MNKNDELKDAQYNSNRFMIELVKRCPCIKNFTKTSTKSRKILAMLQTLGRYNDLMKRLFMRDSVLKTQTEIDKYSEFLKKNRRLRIDIKCLLTEEDENQRKINELKKSINIFGVCPSNLNETMSMHNTIDENKKELANFRNSLLEENEELLFQLKRKLM